MADPDLPVECGLIFGSLAATSANCVAAQGRDWNVPQVKSAAGRLAGSFAANESQGIVRT